MILRIASTLLLIAFVIHVDIRVRFIMLSIAVFGIKYNTIFQYLSALMVICILYQETFDLWTRYAIVHGICLVSYVSPLHVYPLFIGPLMIFGLPEWHTWRIILRYFVFVAVTNKTKIVHRYAWIVYAHEICFLFIPFLTLYDTYVIPKRQKNAENVLNV